MISCTEFILAYNEFFKFLHRRHGKHAVMDLWVGISDRGLGNLRELVAKKGIQGMKEYWGRTLSEEGADYTMTANKDTFTIEMHRCPSVGILNDAHIEKYPNYCAHCEVLYSRIMKDHGFSYQTEYVDQDKGACKITIKRCSRKNLRRNDRSGSPLSNLRKKLPS